MNVISNDNDPPTPSAHAHLHSRTHPFPASSISSLSPPSPSSPWHSDWTLGFKLQDHDHRFLLYTLFSIAFLLGGHRSLKLYWRYAERVARRARVRKMVESAKKEKEREAVGLGVKNGLGGGNTNAVGAGTANPPPETLHLHKPSEPNRPSSSQRPRTTSDASLNPSSAQASGSTSGASGALTNAQKRSKERKKRGRGRTMSSKEMRKTDRTASAQTISSIEADADLGLEVEENEAGPSNSRVSLSSSPAKPWGREGVAHEHKHALERNTSRSHSPLQSHPDSRSYSPNDSHLHRQRRSSRARVDIHAHNDALNMLRGDEYTVHNDDLISEQPDDVDDGETPQPSASATSPTLINPSLSSIASRGSPAHPESVPASVNVAASGSGMISPSSSHAACAVYTEHMDSSVHGKASGRTGILESLDSDPSPQQKALNENSANSQDEVTEDPCENYEKARKQYDQGSQGQDGESDEGEPGEEDTPTPPLTRSSGPSSLSSEIHSASASILNPALGFAMEPLIVATDMDADRDASIAQIPVDSGRGEFHRSRAVGNTSTGGSGKKGRTAKKSPYDLDSELSYPSPTPYVPQGAPSWLDSSRMAGTSSEPTSPPISASTSRQAALSACPSPAPNRSGRIRSQRHPSGSYPPPHSHLSSFSSMNLPPRLRSASRNSIGSSSATQRTMSSATGSASFPPSPSPVPSTGHSAHSSLSTDVDPHSLNTAHSRSSSRTQNETQMPIASQSQSQEMQNLQSEVASYKGALEASRRREENARGEMNRLKRECEGLRARISSLPSSSSFTLNSTERSGSVNRDGDEKDGCRRDVELALRDGRRREAELETHLHQLAARLQALSYQLSHYQHLAYLHAQAQTQQYFQTQNSQDQGHMPQTQSQNQTPSTSAPVPATPAVTATPYAGIGLGSPPPHPHSHSQGDFSFSQPPFNTNMSMDAFGSYIHPYSYGFPMPMPMPVLNPFSVPTPSPLQPEFLAKPNRNLDLESDLVSQTLVPRNAEASGNGSKNSSSPPPLPSTGDREWEGAENGNREAFVTKAQGMIPSAQAQLTESPSPSLNLDELDDDGDGMEMEILDVRKDLVSAIMKRPESIRSLSQSQNWPRSQGQSRAGSGSWSYAKSNTSSNEGEDRRSASAISVSSAGSSFGMGMGVLDMGIDGIMKSALATTTTTSSAPAPNSNPMVDFELVPRYIDPAQLELAMGMGLTMHAHNDNTEGDMVTAPVPDAVTYHFPPGNGESEVGVIDPEFGGEHGAAEERVDIPKEAGGAKVEGGVKGGATDEGFTFPSLSELGNPQPGTWARSVCNSVVSDDQEN